MGLFSRLFKGAGSTGDQARTNKASPNKTIDRGTAKKLKGDIVIPDNMDEIKAGTARAAAETAGQQMAARIKEKAARPAENGTSSQSAVIVKSDVHSLTRAERMEIARRAQRGEKITF